MTLAPVDQALKRLGAQPLLRQVDVRAGTFTIPGVLPGRYTLGARVSPTPAHPNPSGLMATMALVVDGTDQSDIVLDMLPGATIAGRVRLESSTSASRLGPDFRLTTSPLIQDIDFVVAASAAVVDSEGRFTLSNVLPGRYRLAPANAPSLRVSSQVVRGVETIHGGISLRPGEKSRTSRWC